MDWNDLRYLLAVARTGTTLAASRELKVSQSTVARRIVALEEALGLELFDKRQSGYVLTEAGAELRQAAEEVEARVEAFAAQAGAHQRGLSGTVKLTTNETFANFFLLRAMREFRLAYPNVKLEVETSDRWLDLGAGEADVAVRAGPPPTEPDLVGKRLAHDRWSLYCSRDYAARHGMPKSEAEFGGHHFVALDRDAVASPILAWVYAHIPEHAIAMRHSTISGLFVGIKSGLGLSLMSDFIAAAEPELVRCFTPDIAIDNQIWLITHERLRHVPRVRAVLDFLAGYFAAGSHKMRKEAGES